MKKKYALKVARAQDRRKADAVHAYGCYACGARCTALGKGWAALGSGGAVARECQLHGVFRLRWTHPG